MLVHRFLNKFSIEVTILFGVWIYRESFLKWLKWSQAHVKTHQCNVYFWWTDALPDCPQWYFSASTSRGINSISRHDISFCFPNIPETSWMIDSNTEIPNWSQVVTRGLSLTVIIQSIKLTQRTFRPGWISQDNKHTTRNTGSAQLTMRWCSNAGDWAVVLLMRSNGWFARWSWWLISFLEPYHKGSQRYESDPCICDVHVMCKFEDFWKNIDKQLLKQLPLTASVVYYWLQYIPGTQY